MRINIKSTNIELTEAIKSYVEKRMGELDKFLQNIGDAPTDEGQHDPIEIDVEVGKDSNHHNKGDDLYRAEINLAVPGSKHVIRSVSEQWDLYVAVDEAKDDMQRQIKKFKGKKNAQSEKGKRALKRMLRFSRLVKRDDE
ncbi:MAG: ribosome-associated translation inhibitor RaiA [Candidatus Spechtbacterales bacterium]